jgi:hypothetical protein
MKFQNPVRRFQLTFALAAALALATSLHSAAFASHALQPPGEIQIHVINALPDDDLGLHDITNLWVGQDRLLAPREKLEPGDRLDVTVSVSGRMLVQAMDGKKLRARGLLKAPAAGKEYCVLIFPRQSPTFTIRGGRISSTRTWIRSFEGNELGCRLQAMRYRG